MNLKKIHLILFLKPCYNWTAFNTLVNMHSKIFMLQISFKPYYNWNTFNTEDGIKDMNRALEF